MYLISLLSVSLLVGLCAANGEVSVTPEPLASQLALSPPLAGQLSGYPVEFQRNLCQCERYGGHSAGARLRLAGERQ